MGWVAKVAQNRSELIFEAHEEGNMKNLVILIGNLGADPEVRYTPDSTPVASFSVATTEKWKGKDGQMKEDTEWHRIVAWRRLAEICGEYLKKGSKVYLEGKIKTKKYTDQNGVEKHSTEIIAHEMKMLDGKQGGGGSNYGPPSTGEDVPF